MLDEINADDYSAYVDCEGLHKGKYRLKVHLDLGDSSAIVKTEFVTVKIDRTMEAVTLQTAALRQQRNRRRHRLLLHPMEAARMREIRNESDNRYEHGRTISYMDRRAKGQSCGCPFAFRQRAEDFWESGAVTELRLHCQVEKLVWKNPEELADRLRACKWREPADRVYQSKQVESARTCLCATDRLLAFGGLYELQEICVARACG